MSGARYKRTTLYCAGLTALLVGLGVSRAALLEVSGWWALAALIALFCTLRAPRSIRLLLFVCLGLSLGVWRGGEFWKQLWPYRTYTGEKVTLVVRAESSAVYSKGYQLQFDASHVSFAEPQVGAVPGMMVISGYGERSVLRGDTVRVTGKLYARRGGKQAGISYGQLVVEQRTASVVEKTRRNFLAGLTTALPEPLNVFAAGLLVGQRSELPAHVTSTLQIVGLSHVIAVSGYNLTIMVEVARKRFGRRSKYRATIFSIILILPGRADTLSEIIESTNTSGLAIDLEPR